MASIVTANYAQALLNISSYSELGVVVVALMRGAITGDQRHSDCGLESDGSKEQAWETRAARKTKRRTSNSR